MLDSAPKQLQPVWLEDNACNEEILHYIHLSEQLVLQLGHKSGLNGLMMAPQLKVVHEALRMKLMNKKSNGLQAMLASHLYELMPETEEQLRWFPRLAISIDLDHTIQFQTRIRKKTVPKKVARETSCSFHQLD